MRKIIYLIIFLSTAVYPQWDYWDNFNLGFENNVVTDSIVWKIVEIDTANLGNELCNHDWVYSKTRYAKPFSGCLVMHHGFHCDYNDKVRDRICRKCMRKETEREFWYQHRVTPDKTEYELLEEKLR